MLDDLVERDVPIGPLTTYRVGGRAALFVRARSRADLELARQLVVADGLPVLVVGKGSNLLVADRGFPGLVVQLGDGFDGIECRDAHHVVAGGAVSLPVLARRTAANGSAGFEWAVGVPGSVGGAVRMNAGGHGSEMASVLAGVTVVDLAGGRDGFVPAADLDLRYRHSNVAETEVVVSAELVLAAGDREASEREIADIVRWRREHQPGGQNAGSVFTNPPGDSAGRLVDASGLKGFRVGSAHVSTKHANFFQADDGGSADDVRALIDEVRRRVLEATGVSLVPELRMVGFE
jgi:UDP-N-acetylmuramate dehydrogenase